jgi:hypothetical protein
MVKKVLEQLTRWADVRLATWNCSSLSNYFHGFVIISNSSLIRNTRILNMKIRGGQSISLSVYITKLVKISLNDPLLTDNIRKWQ